MNEELSSALAQTLASFSNELLSAKEFALEQAPELVQQLITYHTVLYSVGTFFGIIYWILYLGIIAIGIKLREGELVGVISVFGLLPGLLLTFPMILLAKILIAPKVWLLEYARDLI